MFLIVIIPIIVINILLANDSKVYRGGKIMHFDVFLFFKIQWAVFCSFSVSKTNKCYCMHFWNKNPIVKTAEKEEIFYRAEVANKVFTKIEYWTYNTSFSL